jgi:hypothetical protein
MGGHVEVEDTASPAGMDFFVVPTVRFQLLYVWFAIDHEKIASVDKIGEALTGTSLAQNPAE